MEKNEVLQQKAVSKCRCGYSAVTLRDLERHRQSGYTKYDGYGAVSSNQFIWCCYCDNGPYNFWKFSEHMLKVHKVTSRLCLPAVNQCPFCYLDTCNAQHIKTCRARFRPGLNQYYAPNIYDMPLLHKSKHYQPKYGARLPLNVTRAGSRVLASNSTAVSNVAAHTGISSVASGGVSRGPVPVALFSAITSVMEHSVCATGFAATNTLSYATPLSGIPRGLATYSMPPAPTLVPVMPVRMFSGRFNAPSLPVQNLFGGLALKLFRPAAVPTLLPVPSGSVEQQVSEGAMLVNNAAASSSNVPNTARCVTLTSLSSLMKPNTVMNIVTPASSSQHRSVNQQLADKAQPRVKISGRRDRSSLHSVKQPLPTAKTLSFWSSSGSSTRKRSRRSGSVSSVLSKKPAGIVTSAGSPVVVLDRLSVSVCEVCGSMFEKPLLMCSHLLEAHSISVPEKDFHQDSPHKRVPCICCPMRFFSKQGLSRHMQIVHEVLSRDHLCSRCSETGIVDLIEHFRVKHSVALRTMVEWRVCYLCKLNFTTIADVEKHAISAHADIFPSPLYFRQAIQASLRQRNRTNTVTQRKASVSAQKNSMACSDHPEPGLDVNRKRRHSVIEIDLTQNDSMEVRTVNEKRKEQLDNMVVEASSKTGSASRSPGSEPVRKKARKSSSISADALNCYTPDEQTGESKASSPRKRAHAQHSPTVLEKGAVLGTVSRITKNNPVISLPPTKERIKSGTNASNKPAGVPDVSVHLASLNSAHDTESSVAPPTKKSTKPAGVPDVSVRLAPLNSAHDTESSMAPPTKKSTKPAGVPDVSVRLAPLNSAHDTESSVAPLTKKSTKPAGVPDVSVRLAPLNSAHDTESSVAPLTKKSTKPAVVPDVSVRCLLYTSPSPRD